MQVPSRTLLIRANEPNPARMAANQGYLRSGIRANEPNSARMAVLSMVSSSEEVTNEPNPDRMRVKGGRPSGANSPERTQALRQAPRRNRHRVKAQTKPFLPVWQQSWMQSVPSRDLQSMPPTRADVVRMHAAMWLHADRKARIGGQSRLLQKGRGIRPLYEPATSGDLRFACRPLSSCSRHGINRERPGHRGTRPGFACAWG